jgi:hypothetical protein
MSADGQALRPDAYFENPMLGFAEPDVPDRDWVLTGKVKAIGACIDTVGEVFAFSFAEPCRIRQWVFDPTFLIHSLIIL